ncbi:MAG TPA: DUF4031 domain-containing protein [Kineosporiaceae bacterium]|nr:DUF4031 domain-containing protein [Kineosporiaceae bacterium]
MAVLIDPPIWPAHGRCWSHLVSDLSLGELHAFADAAGIPPRAFEGDHYDIPEERYAQTVTAGAIPVSGRELLRRLQASGLRRPKRRGERVVASRDDLVAGHRVDGVLSALPPLGPVARVHVVIGYAGTVLVVPDDEGYRLPSAEVSGSGGYPATGRALAGALAGPHWVQLPAVQVGYLRRVPHVRPQPDRFGFEVVLRWPELGRLPRDPRTAGGVDGAGGRPVPPFPEWVPVRRALTLLPAELAPVALAEHHRRRPGRDGDPGTSPWRVDGHR